MRAVAYFGPPGTGKTERLVQEARSFLQAKQTVHFLSHTRAAALECGGRMDNPAAAATLHSLCYHILKLNQTNIIDNDKLQLFSKQTGIPLNLGMIQATEGNDYLTAIDRAAARCTDRRQEYLKQEGPHDLAGFSNFCKSYDSWKHAFGFLDFSDILLGVLRNPPSHLKFNTLLIDEAQDLSSLQWKVINVLAPLMDTVMIAGDDDQTVYEWGGADTHGMAGFCDQHRAEAQVLAQSHRVPRATFGLAQTIIGRVKRRVPKKYAPRNFAGRFTAYTDLSAVDWKKLNGTTEKPTLVLVRTRDRGFEIIRELKFSGIHTYRILGTDSFLNTRYGRALDIWAMLQRGENISPAQQRLLWKTCYGPAQKLVKEGSYDTLLSRGWQHSVQMPESALEYFDCTTPGASPTILISTIHNAKGSEASKVLLYSTMSRKVYDSYEGAPDPEHRLMYVGITRAREELHYVEGFDNYSIPCRW